MEKEIFNPTYKLLENDIAQLKELLLKEVEHLKELMKQHDQLTASSIEKDMASTYAKQKETAEALNGLRRSFDENIKSVTERSDVSIKNSDEKVNTLERHVSSRMVALQSTVEDKRDILYKGIQDTFKNMSETIVMTKTGLEEKRDALIKSLDEKVGANLSREIEKFAGVDSQMNTMIKANAEVSTSGINTNRDAITTLRLEFTVMGTNLSSMQKKLGRAEAFIVAILLAVVIAAIKFLFKL